MQLGMPLSMTEVILLFQLKVLITEISSLARGYHLIRILAPEMAAIAQPGQFIQVRVAGDESNDPILARPISIYRIDREVGSLSFIFKVVGRGTRILSGRNCGELLEILGPVGNGFTVEPGIENLALIAGGIGMPPLFCLAEQWRREIPIAQISLFYGGRSKTDFLATEAWEQLGIGIHFATDDGTLGFHGLVTDLFLQQARQNPFDYIMACGPTPMLRTVQKIAVEKNIPGQLSLEAHMACGVGACLGCACQTKNGYRRVCVDGPVFPISEVVL